MTTLLEAAKQALEALEVANSCVDGYYIPKGKTQLPEVEQAITALRQAIEQAEQDWSLLEATQESLREHMEEVNRLRGLLEQAEQSATHGAQPVAWFGVDFDIKTAPPPRQPWVGLDEEEFIYFCAWCDSGTLIEIEELLERKNT